MTKNTGNPSRSTMMAASKGATTARPAVPHREPSGVTFTAITPPTAHCGAGPMPEAPRSKGQVDDPKCRLPDDGPCPDRPPRTTTPHAEREEITTSPHFLDPAPAKALAGQMGGPNTTSPKTLNSTTAPPPRVDVSQSELIASLDEQELQRRIEYLRGFMLEQRSEALEQTLAMRTRYMTLCMENTFHAQNASALVRTAEAFGVQDLYAVEDLCKFSPNVRIVQGADKWVDLHRCSTTGALLGELRRKGYRIVATSPHTEDTTPESFDVRSGPFALFLGTEHAGISEQVREAADSFIRIPMCGFVESLNVSASAAILLYELSSRMRTAEVDWQLTEREYKEILLRWMIASVKDAQRILGRYLDPQR